MFFGPFSLLSVANGPLHGPTQERLATRIQSITTELRKIGRGHDDGKLALPHQANRVSHEELFSGEHKGPAFSPARLWRKSPQIYHRFSTEMRTQLSQPFLGLGGKGIWKPATEGFTPGAESELMRRYIAGELTQRG